MPINYYCDVEVQSNVLTTDVSNSRVGINEASPTETLHVNGAIRTGAASGATYVKIQNDDIYWFNTGSQRASAIIYPNSSSGVLYINGADGATVFFGAPASYTTNINVQGTATLQTISNATSDTDKFLVSDSGTIKYRTGAEVRADIGAGTGDGTVTGTGSSARVAFWNGASNLTSDSEFIWNSTNNYLGIGAGSSPQSPLHVKSTATDDIVRIVGASGGKPQINIYEGTNNVGRIICTGNADFNFSNENSGDINFFTGGSTSMTIASNGTVNIAGGSLTLDGTGRIQGVDTVSAGTDAANKDYVDQHVPTTTQTIITSNFLDGGSTTSSLRIPFNNLVETTSNQYYNCMDMPANGTVKRFRMHNTSGSLSTGFTTVMQIYKNGSTTPTSSGSLSAVSGQIEWEPSNYTFSKGDHLQFAYAKSAGSKYWQGVSASIIIEFNQV
tara:strand:+ start:1343 stop:2671 length:1329 start_codon:yes stop_codon:yes gene_type:complete